MWNTFVVVFHVPGQISTKNTVSQFAFVEI